MQAKQRLLNEARIVEGDRILGAMSKDYSTKHNQTRHARKTLLAVAVLAWPDLTAGEVANTLNAIIGHSRTVPKYTEADITNFCRGDKQKKMKELTRGHEDTIAKLREVLR